MLFGAPLDVDSPDLLVAAHPGSSGRNVSMRFSSNRLRNLVVLGFASALGVACADADPDGELVDTVQEAVTFAPPGPSVVGARQLGFQWSNTLNPSGVLMTPVATSACFLARVGGKFASHDDRVQITNDNGTWKLSGTAPSGELRANAFCATTLTAGAETEWENQTPISMGTSTGRSCYLTAVWGNLAANGEEVRTFIDGGLWKIGGNSAGGRARCVGRIGFSPVSVSPGGGSGFPNTGQSSPTGPNMCALTRASGRFRGGDVRVFNVHAQSEPPFQWQIDALLNPLSDIPFFSHQPRGSGLCFQ